MQKLYRLLSYLVFLSFSLANIVSAQTIPVLGEIQSTGKVFIQSSTGQWSPAMPSYPLLRETVIKTEDGIASIFFRGGSRVDLSRETVVSIVSTPSQYTVKLEKGVLLFNVSPPTSLSVSAASAGILAGNSPETATGLVSVSGTCTEVKSFSGNIQATSTATGPRIVSEGRNLLFGNCMVAAGNPGHGYPPGEVLAKYMILSGMGIILVDSLLKSPYIFPDDLNRGDRLIRW